MNAHPGISYVLPLRWSAPGPISELTGYLRLVCDWVDEVLVVDGSPEPLFQHHRAQLEGVARHIAPAPELTFEMGKVNGVITGIRECRHEHVVIADDDVRYDREALSKVARLLGDADLVRPQNFFDELPWHARWDTARTLLNRVFTGDTVFPVGDFPGTLAVRRQTFLQAGAYDGNAIFENLELMRTVHAAGGTVASPLDVYVARRPPTTAHFFSQRTRQAYDDFAMPVRFGFFLSLPVPLVALVRRGRWRDLSLLALGAIVVAECGRRRSGGSARFPATGSLLAPLWVVERAVCSWLALGARFRGGVRYGDVRIKKAATSVGRLCQRNAPPAAPPPAAASPA